MCLEAAYTGNLEEAEEWKKELEKEFPGMEIHMDPLSLSVACHIGQGAACGSSLKKGRSGVKNDEKNNGINGRCSKRSIYQSRL